MNAQTRHFIRLGLLVLGLGALFFLIVGLGQLELEPGLPFEQIWQFLMEQFGNSSRDYGMGGSLGSGDLIMRIYRTLFWIALVCFPFAVVLMLIDPVLRRKVIRTAIVLLLLLALMALVMDREPPLEEEGLELEGGVLVPPQPLDVERLDVDDFQSEEVSGWIGRTVSLVLGLLLAFIVFVIIQQIAKNRSERGSALDDLARSARRAISDLESGEDLQNAILRCYAEMSRVVRDVRGLRRDHDVTAREFTTVLVRAQLPPGPVQTLTTLFEKARYGAGATTVGDESEAVSSLRAIVQACEELSRLTSDESQVAPAGNHHSSEQRAQLPITRDASDL